MSSHAHSWIIRQGGDFIKGVREIHQGDCGKLLGRLREIHQGELCGRLLREIVRETPQGDCAGDCSGRLRETPQGGDEELTGRESS